MKKAFTLLELVFVIAMLGVLASIAIPKFATNKNEVEIKKAKAQIAQIRAGITSYVNKQILAGESDIYPKYLEKDKDESDELFNNILSQPIIATKAKFNVKEDLTKLIGWSRRNNSTSGATLTFAGRYFLTLPGTTDKSERIGFDYCSKSTEKGSSNPQVCSFSYNDKDDKGNKNTLYGTFLCTDTVEKCSKIGEISYNKS